MGIGRVNGQFISHKGFGARMSYLAFMVEFSTSVPCHTKQWKMAQCDTFGYDLAAK